MFAAEYRSDNSFGTHCKAIKIQHQTERLCLSRHSVGLQPSLTALITNQHHSLVRHEFSQAEHESKKVFWHILLKLNIKRSNEAE